MDLKHNVSGGESEFEDGSKSSINLKIKQKNKQNHSNFWDNIEPPKIHEIRIIEGEEKDLEAGKNILKNHVQIHLRKALTIVSLSFSNSKLATVETREKSY